MKDNAEMPVYVTSPSYAVDIGPHVFPTRKYGRIVERLLAEDGAAPADFLNPGWADETDVLRVHTPGYFSDCREGTLSALDLMRLELPWSQGLFEAASRGVQGSILAGQLAMEHGVGIHIGGGFHHAYPDHGEGFCVFNDHAVAIRRLQADGVIRRALVADCDLHHGNGTAAIFATDDEVATFSIHQEGIYPAHKPPSDLDVGLSRGTGDDEYLDLLRRNLLPLLDGYSPDLLVYVAGADPYREDQLGTLAISLEGLRARDEVLTMACAERGVPLLLVLAGGYAREFEDTVSIHLATVRQVRQLWR